jgi:hypothetical protein
MPQVCPACGKVYMREFDVTGRSAYHRHATERQCERKGCANEQLRDTIVYFGEKVAERELSVAQEHSAAADLAIFIGSSLKVGRSPSLYLLAGGWPRAAWHAPAKREPPLSRSVCRCCSTTSSSGSSLRSRPHARASSS